MRLQGRLASVAELSGSEREAMFTLMDRHYENVNRDTFAADLREKSWVIVVSDPQTGALCGFSTQVLLEVSAGGYPRHALFSGDTIVDRERWGDNALAHVWGQLALSLIERYDDGELYWFLISKGYKTYRFLPLFFHEFYPRHDRRMPAWAGVARDALARHKFPTAYDPATGIVHADGCKDRLRSGVAEVTPERLRDPHVRFFAERNPGHARGDELCCLAPLSRANFTSAAYRVIGSGPAAVEVVR
jgi:hypothetical protein